MSLHERRGVRWMPEKKGKCAWLYSIGLSGNGMNAGWEGRVIVQYRTGEKGFTLQDRADAVLYCSFKV